jgi:hypothetical protein
MTTTKETDAEQLQAEAARLNALAAEAQSKLQEHRHAEAMKLHQRQLQYDKHINATYRMSEYDKAVAEALADVQAVVRDMPITQALARYQAAQVTRYTKHHEMLAARSNLGLPTAGAQTPPSADLLPVSEYIHRAAETMAGEITAKAQADAHAARNGATP